MGWWLGVMGDERKRGRHCMAQRGNEGEKEEGDLKRVTCWFKSNAIDRTYVRSISFMLSVYVKWVFAFEQTQVTSNAWPCLRSNVQGTVDRTAHFFF